MVAMLIGTVGLLGTIAVQQSILSASKNANDASIAMRLATQKIEEFGTRNTDNETADVISGLTRMATQPGMPVIWYPFSASNEPIAEYVDAEGVVLRNSDSASPRLPTTAEVGRYRWHRQWSVVNTGTGTPYVISVIVTYNNDVGSPKTVRLDLERTKTTW
jgi:hypothetical protein